MNHLGWICGSFWQHALCCVLGLTWSLIQAHLYIWRKLNDGFCSGFLLVWLTGIWRNTRHVPLQVLWLYNLELDPQQVSKDSCRWKGRKGTCKAGFPCLFVSFQDHVSLVSLCVSSSPLFLHSSLFLFLYFLVFDIFLPPLYSLFVLSLSAFGEHWSSIGVFVPAGLACAQMASEKPGHCAAAWYGPGTSQTAPVSCVWPSQGCHRGTPVTLTSMEPHCSTPSPIL